MEVPLFEPIRKKRKNPFLNFIGWSLIVFVCIVFIFIGYDFNSSNLGSTGAAAEVNGTAISLRAFLDRVKNVEDSQQGQRGDRKELKSQILNLMVDQQLVVQEAEKLNIVISDDEVANELMNIPAFIENDVFSQIRYKNYILQNRTTESQFENKIREFLVYRKALGLVKSISDEIPLVKEFEDQLDKAKINISYLAFNKFNSKTVGAASAEDAGKYLADNPGKVEEYYTANKVDFLQKKEVKARHILAKTDPKDPASDEKALAKINKVALEANAGNFAEMAKKYSEGPSKTKGGDLGFFSRERMVPEFSAKAFSMEKGQISEPVKTKFGYHLILVEDKKEERQKPLDEVKDNIARTMIQEERFDKLATSLEEALKSDSLEAVNEIAQKNGLSWKDTGLFSITDDYIPGVGKIAPFMDASMQLTKAQPRSKTLLKYMNNRYILKLKDAKIDNNHKPKANAQFDFLKQYMAQQKSQLVLQKWIGSIRKRSNVKINASVLN